MLSLAANEDARYMLIMYALGDTRCTRCELGKLLRTFSKCNGLGFTGAGWVASPKRDEPFEGK